MPAESCKHQTTSYFLMNLSIYFFKENKDFKLSEFFLKYIGIFPSALGRISATNISSCRGRIKEQYLNTTLFLEFSQYSWFTHCDMLGFGAKACFRSINA